MLERGLDVSYETIRRWSVKIGSLIAHVLRRQQPRHGDVWHLDEVVVKITGRSIGYGVPSTNTALFLRKSCNRGETSARQSGFWSS